MVLFLKIEGPVVYVSEKKEVGGVCLSKEGGIWCMFLKRKGPVVSVSENKRACGVCS